MGAILFVQQTPLSVRGGLRVAFCVGRDKDEVMIVTERQKRFCDEYLIDLNATQAAVRAGYSEKTAGQIGEQNLKKLEISEYIKRQLEAMHKDSIATADEVLGYLTSVLRAESKSRVVIGTPMGAQEIDKPPDEKERLKAAELLGKYHAIWTDRSQVENIGPVQIINDIPRGDSGG